MPYYSAERKAASLKTLLHPPSLTTAEASRGAKGVSVIVQLAQEGQF